MSHIHTPSQQQHSNRRICDGYKSSHLILLICGLFLNSNYSEWNTAEAFSFTVSPSITTTSKRMSSNTCSYPITSSSSLFASNYDSEFNIDDDDYDDADFFATEEEDDEDSMEFARLSQKQRLEDIDYSGVSKRQFRLGYDISLSSYAGALGFDEVVDWEYYKQDENGERVDDEVVNPPFMDPTKPKRTRESSGSVVRVFLGEFIGTLGNTIRSRGLDRRILAKEFSGPTAIELAKSEMKSLSRIQSNLCSIQSINAKEGKWSSTASTRYIEGKTQGNTKADDDSLINLIELFNNVKADAPYTCIYGELDLTDYIFDDDIDPNEWYRALKVPPPKPNSIWIVYEYAGLSTLSAYAQPAPTRLKNLPPQRGFFGNVVAPPSLPPWKERANYVVRGILQKSLEAVATLHEGGIVHRSIGRDSVILSSVAMDKTEASSPYATVSSRLVVKLSDFGFSGLISDSCNDESFRQRAKAFKIDVREGLNTVESNAFAMAEDLHALGFVFLGVLLTSLADIPMSEPDYRLPPTDEDSLQRLLGEIFEGDIDEFRTYCEEEEVWGNVVELLDGNDGAGWDLLNDLCFARERVRENKGTMAVSTAKGLLSSPFFDNRRR